MTKESKASPDERRGCFTLLALPSGYLAFVLWRELLGPPATSVIEAGLGLLFLMPIAVIATALFFFGVVGLLNPDWLN